MEKINVNIKYLSPLAKKPCYQTPGSAGMDLSAAIEQEVVLRRGETRLIPTGIAISLPDAGCVALIYARSGLAIKHGVTMANCVGVIDSDYRGEIKVGVINLGSEDYTICPGERIAQMVFAPVLTAQLCEADSLGETQRGSGGFGSTGA